MEMKLLPMWGTNGDDVKITWSQTHKKFGEFGWYVSENIGQTVPISRKKIDTRYGPGTFAWLFKDPTTIDLQATNTSYLLHYIYNTYRVVALGSDARDQNFITLKFTDSEHLAHWVRLEPVFSTLKLKSIDNNQITFII